MFKRICLALGLALGLSVSAHATETCSKASGRANGELPSCIAIDRLTDNGESAIIDTFGYRFNSVSIKVAEASSELVVNILCRGYDNDTTGIEDQWHVCAESVVNPDNTTSSAQAISLARAYQYKITVSGYISGTVSVFFERYSDR